MSKIDFVLTWVDGADREWQEERRKYNPAKGAADQSLSGKGRKDTGVLCG